MKLYEPEVGDWVVLGKKIGLVVEVKLDGYVRVASDSEELYYHYSTLRLASSDEIRCARIGLFDSFAKQYRKQLFTELCRIKKWKRIYKKEADLPIKEVNTMVRMGWLPVHAAANWNPM
jgi:hypothetical protein